MRIEPPVSIRPQPAEIERDGVERDDSHFVLVFENPEQQPVAAGILVDFSRVRWSGSKSHRCPTPFPA